MYIAKLTKRVETEKALVITVQSLDLLPGGHRRVYLPKSQIKIKTRADGEVWVYMPDWLIIKNHIPWCRITEMRAISPTPKYALFEPLIGGRKQ